MIYNLLIPFSFLSAYLYCLAGNYFFSFNWYCLQIFYILIYFIWRLNELTRKVVQNCTSDSLIDSVKN